VQSGGGKVAPSYWGVEEKKKRESTCGKMGEEGTYSLTLLLGGENYISTEKGEKTNQHDLKNMHVGVKGGGVNQVF